MSTNTLGQQLRDKLDMLDRINKQQTCAATALRLLNRAGFNAVILGGAPRDWLHDRLAKDLDIYIQYDQSKEQLFSVMNKIESALYLEPYELVDITSQCDYVRNIENGVTHVLNVLNLAMPIQIILCDREPMKMLEVFHGSLSQAYATHEVSGLNVKGSKVFELGKRFKVHFIKKEDDPKYIQKVTEKYPDYMPVFEK